MKIQDQSVYYHYNPRGDVIVMTDKDGQIVASYEYDAWGNVLKSEAKGIAAANPFGYKEKIWINILKYTNLQQKITNIF
ncbi:Rhs family protein [Bacillus thuringiensis]|nr:Rhs family protein [Bacillus thuringiensis]